MLPVAWSFALRYWWTPTWEILAIDVLLALVVVTTYGEALKSTKQLVEQFGYEVEKSPTARFLLRRAGFRRTHLFSMVYLFVILGLTLILFQSPGITVLILTSATTISGVDWLNDLLVARVGKFVDQAS